MSHSQNPANINSNTRKILVTSALPYANGAIHLGHLVEYIQTDIWVRFQQSQGHLCHYVCADDAHGTPIMLRAQNENISPEALIEKTKIEHKQDFDKFFVNFDNFYTTHSEENKELACLIYNRLNEAGHISRKTISQAYDPVKNMFLPDRFIKGECPKCAAADQYGDNCENCGATYAATELKNPVSVVSGAKPIEKESEHYFFKVTDFEKMLKEWISTEHLQEEISNKLQEWFTDGLQEWDISRDAPYFGFNIPGTTEKYFYVWLEAPIGYIASFKNLCDNSDNLNFDDYWGVDSDAELYHFIGKDIVNFHGLFWPAMLHGAKFRKPTAVWAHGFLTVDGKKMSKSRGTFIQASTFVKHLQAEYLRYYFAAKLNASVGDIDLNMADFRVRVNSDLVGKVINIASRCAGFINKRFDATLSKDLDQPELFAEFIKSGENIQSFYESREYSKAMREIMLLADKANQYIDLHKPWQLIKQQGQEEKAHAVCSMALNLFHQLMIYLYPVLPDMASKVDQFLNVQTNQWKNSKTPLLAHTINPFIPLLSRIEEAQIDAMIEETKANLATENTLLKKSGSDDNSSKNTAPVTADFEPIAETISFEDFAKLDLRIAKIIAAEKIVEADKLLRVQVDLGNEQRTIIAGIKSAYEPEALTGQLVVVVANLAPRKMRFGISEGMILAAGPGGEDLWVLNPDMTQAKKASAGMRVK